MIACLEKQNDVFYKMNHRGMIEKEIQHFFSFREFYLFELIFIFIH